MAVGACGAGRYADCPNDSWHQILCCTLPDFYFGNCFSYGSEHGKPNSCLEHGEVPTMLEGTCGSGTVNVVGKGLSNPFSINQILYFFVQIFKQEFFFKNRFFSLASCTI